MIGGSDGPFCILMMSAKFRMVRNCYIEASHAIAGSEARTLIQQKAIPPSNWRSLVGVPALALVGKHRTKEGGKLKIHILPAFHTAAQRADGGAGW